MLPSASRFSVSVLLISGIASFAGCSSTGSQSATIPATAAHGVETSASTAHVSLVISRGSNGAATRSPQYVSQSTQSASVSVAAANAPANTLATTTGSCTTTCQLSLNAPIGNDVFTVTLYDKLNGQGDVLSTGTTTSAIAENAPNALSVVLDGVVASLAVSAGSTSITTGTAASIPLVVTAKDSQNNTIIGTYDRKITLTDTDTSSATSITPTAISSSATSVNLAYTGNTAFSAATISASAAGVTASPASSIVISAGVPLQRCINGELYGKTFDDEFNTFNPYTGNSGTWSTSYNWGRTNPGAQDGAFYVDSGYTGGSSTPLGINPFAISNGNLLISANPAAPSIEQYISNQPYTSGLIQSESAFTQQYGYFETRMLLPTGQGIWPAFWMLPISGWPPEIDVMEMLGNAPSVIYQTTHAPNGSQQQVITTGVQPNIYHTFAVQWTSSTITYFIDGNVTAHYPNISFQPMYMIANVQVGLAGSWPGAPDATTKFPATMAIDYIRAYQDAGSTCSP